MASQSKPGNEVTGDRKPAAQRVREDASGQFAPSQADRRNTGLDSANPRVLSKDGRAPGYSWDERPGDPEKRLRPRKHSKKD